MSETKGTRWIDFEKIPVDTVVDVRLYEKGFVFTKFFVKVSVVSANFVACMSPISINGYACSVSNYTQIRISAKNPWLPWFGGECPVPKNCMVEFINSNKASVIDLASNFNWQYGTRDFDFAGGIAYRLLESPWQTTDGVDR